MRVLEQAIKNKKSLALELVTHPGQFHADDILAYVVLCYVHEEAYRLKLVRTRTYVPRGVKHIFFDVGMKYLPEKDRYDHHQPGGAGSRSNGVPYASAGLIWLHFGREYLRRFLKPYAKVVRRYGGPAIIERVWGAVDRNIIQAVDSLDNRALRVETTLGDASPLYVPLPLFPDLVAPLNPATMLGESVTSRNFDRAFLRAVTVLGSNFKTYVRGQLAQTIAQSIVEKHDRSNLPILVIDVGAPWQFFEPVVARLNHLRFVVSPDDIGQLLVHAVARKPGSERFRRLFPKEWAGKRQEELERVTGVPGAIFCHGARFVCGAKTLKGARRLAELALEER